MERDAKLVMDRQSALRRSLGRLEMIEKPSKERLRVLTGANKLKLENLSKEVMDGSLQCLGSA